MDLLSDAAVAWDKHVVTFNALLAEVRKLREENARLHSSIALNADITTRITRERDEARAKLAKVVEEIETLMGGDPDALVSGAYLLAAAKGEE